LPKYEFEPVMPKYEPPEIKFEPLPKYEPPKFDLFDNPLSKKPWEKW
jgi:hypothetical protein